MTDREPDLVFLTQREFGGVRYFRVRRTTGARHVCFFLNTYKQVLHALYPLSTRTFGSVGFPVFDVWTE